MARRKSTKPAGEQPTSELPAWQKLANQIDADYPATEQTQAPKVAEPTDEVTVPEAQAAELEADVQPEAPQEDIIVTTSPPADAGEVDTTFVAVLPDEEVDVPPTAEYLDAENDSDSSDDDDNGEVHTVADTWMPLTDAAALIGVKYQQVYQRAVYMKKLDTHTGNDSKLLVRRSQVLERQAKRTKVGKQDN